VTESDPADLKPVVLAVLIPTIAWQIYLVFLLMRTAPAMQQFASGLGAELAPVTRAFIGFYPWSWTIPLFSALLGVDVLRRARISRAHAVAVVVTVITLGFALHAWATEAWFRPMMDLMRAVG
jgi:hypothetical protein